MTGEVQGLAETECEAKFILEAIDKFGARDIVESTTLTFQHRDTANPTNGPNNRTCQHNGRVVDGVAFDRTFTCNCSAYYTGDNCELDIDIASNDGNDVDLVPIIAASVLAPLVTTVALALLVLKYRAYRLLKQIRISLPVFKVAPKNLS